jgi:indoleacetamide hydrolase
MAFRDALITSYRRTFAAAAIHAVIYPTVVTTAPVLGDDRTLIRGGRETDLLETIVANATASTILGTPALSLPSESGPRSVSDLPVGISVEGLPGGDVDLLRTAWEVERRLE